jgi:hypothetical protein
MLQLEHKKRIVDACYPESYADALKLWHDIKPVKFGGSVQWIDVSPETTSLAGYQIPPDASYLLILRVECYVTTFIAAAPGFGQFAPPPNSNAFWAIDAAPGAPERITPTLPIHVFADSDEFLMVKDNHLVALLSALPAPPDGNARFIRTLVYAYLLGAMVADRIGDGESTYA